MQFDWLGRFARMPEKLWRRLEPLLPWYPRSPNGGRPRVCLRGVANAIFYLLCTGCQWKALPPQFGAPSTVHRYFQEWARRRVFHRFWKKCLQIYDARRGIGWRWQALDGAMTKAPLGGGKTGKNPTDRGKLGVKRSVVTDCRGVPLGIAAARANTHDAKLLRPTLTSIPIPRPKSAARRKQHLCLDKGYCGRPTEILARRFHYTLHVPRKGEEPPKRRPEQRARRWVVEGSPGQTARGVSLCDGKLLFSRRDKKLVASIGLGSQDDSCYAFPKSLQLLFPPMFKIKVRWTHESLLSKLYRNTPADTKSLNGFSFQHTSHHIPVAPFRC